MLSNFRGSEDHDGTKLSGLDSPAAPGAVIGEARLGAMVRKAIEFGNTRQGGLAAIVERGDWVVIKPQITPRFGTGGRAVAGSVADPRVVKELVAWLVENKRARRITVAEAPFWPGEARFDPWTSAWDGAYGGTSYRAVIDAFTRSTPGVKFELLDLNQGATMPMQGPGQDSPAYHVASAVLQCDRLITVAPLSTAQPGPVALTVGSYAGVLPAAHRSQAFQASPTHQVLAELFSFRPADYAILGGEWGLEGDGPSGRTANPVRHNLILAGANAIAVDAVGAAVMGFEAARIPHLALAARKGLGTTDLDVIWTRGNSMEEARRPFRAPISN